MEHSNGKTRAYKIINNYVNCNPEKLYLLDSFNVDLAHLGNKALESNDHETAKTAYQIDLELRKILLVAEPHNPKWQRNLSISYENMGDLARETGGAEKAIPLFEHAIELMKNLKQSDQEMADLYAKLSFVLISAGCHKRLYSSLKSCLTALKNIERLGQISEFDREIIPILDNHIRKIQPYG